LGCGLGFELKGIDVRGVEYVRDSRNEGRLCPKGNLAAEIINSKKRLYHPILKGKNATLTEGIKHLKETLSKYKAEEILLVHDSSLTNQEANAFSEWASSIGCKNVAYFTSGPESAFMYGQRKPLAVEQVTSGEFALIIGDAFAQDSVISGYIGKAKGDNRNFRYIVIDSVGSNTSKFAHQFVKVRSGLEGLFLYGLYMHVSAQKVNLSSIAENTGVEESVFEQVAGMIRNKNGLLVYAPCYARDNDSLLTHGTALKLAAFLEQTIYIPLGQRTPALIGDSFFSYIPQIESGKIKAVVSLGQSFPWSYPQLKPILRKTSFIAAGTNMIPDDYFELELVLPMSSQYEKTGTIMTLFGEEQYPEPVFRISGTLSTGEYLSNLGTAVDSKKSLSYYHSEIDEASLKERAERLIKNKPSRKKGMNHRLIGSSPAIGFMSIYEKDDWVKINSKDASFMGIADGDLVAVETEQGNTQLTARICDDVSTETALVSINYIPSFGLFALEQDTDTGEGIVKPSWSKIWKK
jgi:anaerobic selenocysteine-containing dehydrogenase